MTNYRPAMDAAEQNGWELLREDRQISESFSVDFASIQCAKRGVTALLRLPLDVPLVQSNDIDELLALECAAPGLVIVPSRDGMGTNAILRTPPTLFPSHFGVGSFAQSESLKATESFRLTSTNGRALLPFRLISSAMEAS